VREYAVRRTDDRWQHDFGRRARKEKDSLIRCSLFTIVRKEHPVLEQVIIYEKLLLYPFLVTQAVFTFHVGIFCCVPNISDLVGSVL
jgi:hypothetical protein